MFDCLLNSVQPVFRQESRDHRDQTMALTYGILLHFVQVATQMHKPYLSGRIELIGTGEIGRSPMVNLQGIGTS